MGVIKENYNHRYGELLKIKETVYAEDHSIFFAQLYKILQLYEFELFKIITY